MSLLLDQYRDGTISDSDAALLAGEIRAGGDALRDWQAENLVVQALERISDEEFHRSFLERWRDDVPSAPAPRPSYLGRIVTMAASLLAVSAIFWALVHSPRQESDVQAILDRFKSEDAAQRDKAYENLIARWKEWTPEAMDRISKGREDADAEVASRCKAAIARIGLRRKIGAELVGTPGLEEGLSGNPAYDDRFTMLKAVIRKWIDGTMSDASLAALAAHWNEQGWRLRFEDIRGVILVSRPVRPIAGLIAAHLDGKVDPGGEPADPRAAAERVAAMRVPLETIVALDRLDARDQAAKVAPFLDHADSWTRASAAMALGKFRARAYLDGIRNLLKDDLPQTRAAAARALCLAGEIKEGLDSMAGALKDDAFCDASSIAGTLAGIGDARCVGMLEGMTKHIDERVRRTAMWALGRLGGSILPLIDGLEDRAPRVRIPAVIALAAVASRVPADREAAIRKLEALKGAGAEVGLAARIGLVRLGTSDRATMKNVLEEVSAVVVNRPELERALFDALLAVHEPKTWDRLTRPIVLSRSITGASDLAAVIADAGLALEVPEQVAAWNRFEKGASIRLADLMDRMNFVVWTLHLAAEGSRVWQASPDSLTKYWKERLSKP